MGHDLDAPTTGKLGDLARHRESAAAGDVRLQHVHVAMLDERSERSEARVRLSCGDTDGGGVRKAAVAVVVVRLERLLEPVEIDVLEPSEQLERALHRVGTTPVEHERARWSQYLPRRPHELLVVIEVASERAPAELERSVPVIDCTASD